MNIQYACCRALQIETQYTQLHTRIIVLPEVLPRFSPVFAFILYSATCLKGEGREGGPLFCLGLIATT